MKNIIVFNRICSDGIGDFIHFQDITNVLIRLQEGSLDEFNIVPVICYDDESIANRVSSDLKKMGLTDAYCGNHERFMQHDKNTSLDELKAKIKDAALIVLISMHLFPRVISLTSMRPSGTKILFIGEHERCAADEIAEFLSNDLVIKSLGLSAKSQGIKISSNAKLDVEDAFEVIKSHDKSFFDSLFVSTNSVDVQGFQRHNYFVSSYFHNLNHFARFLLFLLANKHLDKQKDIALFLSSGKKSSEMVADTLDLLINKNLGTVQSHYFKNLDVGSIELITPTFSRAFILNPDSKRSMRVFNGYRLSDPSFEALDSCDLLIKGVSGDNTLEKAISKQLLFYYISTNEGEKHLTIRGLYQIVEGIPSEDFGGQAIKDQFLTLFNQLPFYIFAHTHLNNQEKEFESQLDKMSNLNLEVMRESVPVITNYIRNNKNFYNVIEKLILSNINPSMTKDINAGANPSSFFHATNSSQEMPIDNDNTPKKKL